MAPCLTTYIELLRGASALLLPPSGRLWTRLVRGWLPGLTNRLTLWRGSGMLLPPRLTFTCDLVTTQRVWISRLRYYYVVYRQQRARPQIVMVRRLHRPRPVCHYGCTYRGSTPFATFHTPRPLDRRRLTFCPLIVTPRAACILCRAASCTYGYVAWTFLGIK